METDEAVTELAIRRGDCHRSRVWGGSAVAYFPLPLSGGRASTKSCSAVVGPLAAAAVSVPFPCYFLALVAIAKKFPF